MANFYPTSTSELISTINTANGNGESNTIILNGGIYEFTTYDTSDPINGDLALPEITSDLTIMGNNSTLKRASTAPALASQHFFRDSLR